MIIIFYNLVSLMDYKEWVKMNSLIVTDELMIKTLEQFYLLKGNIDSKKSFFDFRVLLIVVLFILGVHISFLYLIIGNIEKKYI